MANAAPTVESNLLLLHEKRHPPNPVLVALKIASACRDESHHYARDRAISEQLSTAANLLENVASGVLQGAVRAAIERDEKNKTFNPWVTGKRPLEPRIARDFFTTSSLHLAAEHELKVFVSNPFLYAHLQDLFWPRPPESGVADGLSSNAPASSTPGGTNNLMDMATVVQTAVQQGAAADGGGTVGKSRRLLKRMTTKHMSAGALSAPTSGSGSSTDGGALAPRWTACGWLHEASVYCGLLLLHVLVLPVLMFIPRSWEVAIEDQQRQMVTSRQLPFGLAWFFPAGRIALWTASTIFLASLLTVIPPPDFGPAEAGSRAAALAILTGSLHDGMLLLYLLGWATYELQDFLATDTRSTYFRDVFNIVDLSLITALAFACATRLAAPDNAHLMLPCQAISAMLAWLRLLQVLYIFPSTGPLLIMTIRMFHDLYQFLVLAAFVILAFAAAFRVLLNGEADVAWEAAGVATGVATDLTSLEGVASDAPRVPITFGAVITLMLEGTLTGEPDRIMGLHSGADHALGNFTWTMMALFGVVVVLLLLNLLIARFAKTFDIVYENVDANFKVAFARVVLKGGTHELVPPPFNLVRRVVLLLYAFLVQSPASHAPQQSDAGCC